MRGFTAYDLLCELSSELESLFAEFKLLNSVGEEVAPKVYKLGLPIPEGDDDTELSFMPYIELKLTDGKIKDWDTSDKIKELSVMAIVGVYNSDPSRAGLLDVLSIIQRIENHLGKKRQVGNFRVGADFEYAISETDTHPFYFGGVMLTFEAPRVIKENPLV